jgi:hypothetical protein
MITCIDYFAGIGAWELAAEILEQIYWKKNNPPLDCGVPRNTPGRREAINLIGRSIVPLQAAIPLMRVKFLASL